MNRLLGLFFAIALSTAAMGEPVQPRTHTLEGTGLPQQLQATPDGQAVWFAAANLGAIGRLNVRDGTATYYALGNGTRPRGLAIGKNGNVYAFDQALNLIHDLDPATGALKRHLLPADAPHLDLAEAALADDGRIWFSGYSGWYGVFDPLTGEARIWPAETGRGVYSVAVASDGRVWLASLAANAIAVVDPAGGTATWFSAPKGVSGIKGLAVDRQGAVWLAASKSGRIVRFEPQRKSWLVLPVPGDLSRPHALGLAADGTVFFTDVASDRLIALDPKTRAFYDIAELTPRGMAKHLVLSNGVLWIAESAADQLRELPVPTPVTN